MFSWKTDREKREFTTSEGVVLKCRPVPAAALIRLKQKYPAPEAPLQQTDVGAIRNEKDSAYLAALAEYSQKIQVLTINAFLEFGVQADGLNELIETHVPEARENMRALGEPIDELSNKQVLLTYYLIPSEDELVGLFNFIESLSRPTESEVAAHRDSFRGDVPKEA